MHVLLDSTCIADGSLHGALQKQGTTSNARQLVGSHIAQMADLHPTLQQCSWELQQATTT